MVLKCSSDVFTVFRASNAPRICVADTLTGSTTPTTRRLITGFIMTLSRRWTEKIEALSIEDCHWKNDLSLFEKFTKSKAIVGLVDISVSRIEPMDEIAARISQIRAVLPDDRIIGAPDCGLGFLGRELTLIKLGNLCAAAAKA